MSEESAKIIEISGKRVMVQWDISGPVPINRSCRLLDDEFILSPKIVRSPDREEMIKLFPHNGIIAEIGVAQGVFSKSLLETDPKQLYLIDCWVDENEHQIVKDKFGSYENVELIKEFSVPAAEVFPDRFFDWVYIDADHYKKSVLEDLDAWHKKVKVGGIIAGHDYMDGLFEWVEVVPALKEWLPVHDYQLDFLSNEICASWAFVVK